MKTQTILLLGIIIALGASVLCAQSPYNATVSGTVAGEGGALAGASVQLLRGPLTVRQAATDSTGRFHWIDVPPAEYELVINSIGYRTRTLRSLVLRAGQTRRLTITLDLAPVALKSVEATATRVKVDARSTAQSAEIPEMAIALMPLAHDPSEVVGIVPGARPGQVWGGSNLQANNYQLDGLSTNHPGLGGNLVEPSLNWIERIEVKGLGAGAEEGNFQGGLINIVTKTGDNRRRGSFRNTIESDMLNGSNIVPEEIGSEVATRYDLGADLAGPLVRDHLFYFIAGDYIRLDSRFLNHTFGAGKFIGEPQTRRETKLFAKLTWKPGSRDVIEGIAGRVDNTTNRFGMTGYETPEATARYSAPTTFSTLSWTRVWATWSLMEAKLNQFTRQERQEPYGGVDIPAVQFYSLRPPAMAFNNAPITLRHEPKSFAGSLTWSLRARAGGADQILKLGAEASRGSFLDQRIRNGGMTWRPTRRSSVDPKDPATWPFSAGNLIPVTWGGEVDLNADVENTATFAQASLGLGRRLVLTPGIRWGRWSGWLLPHGDAAARFLAMRDRGWDPRMGLIFDLTGNGTGMLKAHWGRYHQSMVAQFFDRIQGGAVFANEELWFYYGNAFTDPATRFTVEQRALAQQGVFIKQSELILNESGKLGSYRQPSVDQWVLALERGIGSSVKLRATYVNRANRNMVALVDENRASNYTAFKNVFVLDPSFQRIPFEGGNVFLKEVFVRNDRLKWLLTCKAEVDCLDIPPVPGMTIADTAHLSWDPQYVLTNAPDGRRSFEQIQFVVNVARPTWGADVSWVLSRLKGNLDNVTGYEDPQEYSAGPYVRVNESVNAYGYLPNYAASELKVSFYGNLWWQLRGGVYYTEATGDHYSPRFTLSGMGGYEYQRTISSRPAGYLWHGLFNTSEGQNIFVGPRGAPTMPTRTRLDVHLERALPGPLANAYASLDMFNVFNSDAVTKFNASVNNGRNYYFFLTPPFGEPRIDANEYYAAVRQRVAPRTIRLGIVVSF